LLPLVLWIKAFHVIAVIAWMAGMLYLPRLFVYHCEAAKGSESSERFKRMEKRLLRGIVNPAMIAVWLSGPPLAWLTGAYAQGWLQLKFVLVLVLSGLHGFFATTVKRFARDENSHSPRFYRIVNEVPALLMVLIVILAVVKPF
ncbi:MAG TPA: protoporphyrinogen oxidase HemJ, partial [Rhizomicrobium sp.]